MAEVLSTPSYDPDKDCRLCNMPVIRTPAGHKHCPSCGHTQVVTAFQPYDDQGNYLS